MQERFKVKPLQLFKYYYYKSCLWPHWCNHTNPTNPPILQTDAILHIFQTINNSLHLLSLNKETLSYPPSFPLRDLHALDNKILPWLDWDAQQFEQSVRQKEREIQHLEIAVRLSTESCLHLAGSLHQGFLMLIALRFHPPNIPWEEWYKHHGYCASLNFLFNWTNRHI